MQEENKLNFSEKNVDGFAQLSEESLKLLGQAAMNLTVEVVEEADEL